MKTAFWIIAGIYIVTAFGLCADVLWQFVNLDFQDRVDAEVILCVSLGVVGVGGGIAASHKG